MKGQYFVKDDQNYKKKKKWRGEHENPSEITENKKLIVEAQETFRNDVTHLIVQTISFDHRSNY